MKKNGYYTAKLSNMTCDIAVTLSDKLTDFLKRN